VIYLVFFNIIIIFFAHSTCGNCRTGKASETSVESRTEIVTFTPPGFAFGFFFRE
jgi:hypothetical protein